MLKVRAPAVEPARGKRNRLSRFEVAAALDVTPKTLYLWEKRGKIPPPQRDWRGWRSYTPQQVEQIRKLVGPRRGRRAAPRRQTPELAARFSARNRFLGTITEIQQTGVTAEVVLDIGGGHEVVAVITSSSVRRLGLKVGRKAYALIKATEVLLLAADA